MKIQNVLNYCQTYKEISEKALPVGISYKLMKIYKGFNDSVEFYQKQFQNIIDNYALKNEEGKLIITEDNTIMMDSQRFEEWNKKLEELNNLEVDTPEPFIDIKDIETIRLNLKQTEAISFLIK